tara:strand:+ start:71 stop:241 length:171 start_codon:yes stop_codon:yes gene_type:complete
MKRKKDYKQKIVFHSNRLHEALNAAPSEYNSENIKKSLESLNYFVERQLEENFRYE